MALETPKGSSFDRDFEFDAPQWIDFEYEKNHLEDEPNNDQFDWWFQKVHPLHSPNLNPTPEPQPKPKMRPPRRSVLGTESSKLPTEAGQFSLTSSKTGLTGKSPPTSNSSLIKKTSLSGNNSSIASKTSKGSFQTSVFNLKPESITTNSVADETNATNFQVHEVLKRPRKCWQLNGHCSVSFSPQTKLPQADLLPQRASSSGSFNAKKTSFSTPSTKCCTNLTPSPLTIAEQTKKAEKSKNVRMARRSCPQKLHKTQETWNESSSKKSKNDEAIDDEIQKLIEQHNRKILSQQSGYDLNGRKIRKTASPQKPVKKDNSKENAKPSHAVSSATIVKENLDEELRDIINNHNRRIWAAQNSTYDLNGRRVRKGKTTMVAPITKTKSERQRSPTKHKTLGRSNETSQKRKNLCQTSGNSSKAAFGGPRHAENSTDFESEIEDIINFHNSRLAAKKAKK